MDIIGHLTRTVTPKVLGDNRTPQSESLLEQFYAIFAARLADNDTYGRFSGQDIAHDDHRFFDKVWTDASHRNSISKELATEHNIDESSVKNLVATAAPLTYHELNTLAGNTPVPQFLRDNLSTYRNHIPGWATTIVPAGLLVAEPAGTRISDTVSTAPLQREEETGGSFMKALLPIIGLIILGALAWALLRGCNDQEQVATVTPAVVDSTQPPVTDNNNEPVMAEVGVEPASLSISSGENNVLYACRANVGDEGLRDRVMSAISGVFVAGEADKCRADVDNDFAADMPAAEYLPAILQLIKDTPNASAIIKGDTIALNSPDSDSLTKLVGDVQTAAPGLNVIAEGPLDIENEINDSLSATGTAFDRLDSNSEPRDVARALSLQVINFELDKAFIPEVNKPLLDRAAKIIQDVPNLKLMIIGHTDSQASDAYNMNLSRERAESVRDYLISKGVDADKLVTKGMGESEPVATNETPRGRFRNRRIEFRVYDESIDGEGIKVTSDMAKVDPDLNPLDNNNDDVLPDGDDNTIKADPDLNPLDNNNDDMLPDGDDTILDADPDLNPLDNNNDDILPDSDDTILGNGTKTN